MLVTEVIDKSKLLIKSPNNQYNVGEERDKYIPNPACISAEHLASYFKIGMILAACLKMGDCLPINLPTLFFKLVRGEQPTWSDFKAISINQVVCLEKISNMKPEEVEELEEQFITYFGDGKEIELFHGSKQINLSAENRSDYIAHTKRVQMSRVLQPFKAMAEGFNSVIPKQQLAWFTPEKIEKFCVGMNYVDIQKLKMITVYKSFPTDPATNHQTVLWFWEALSEFTQDELASYLRYVWGRSRLGHSMDSHRLTYVSNKKGGIPEAHTCFFELDLYEYDSKEELCKKLKYAMDNCTMIIESSSTITLPSNM